MKKIRKFYNEDGTETSSANADFCQELVLDDKGNVIESRRYFPREKTN